MAEDRLTPRLARLITISEFAFISSFIIGTAPMLVERLRLFDGFNVIKLSLVAPTPRATITRLIGVHALLIFVVVGSFGLRFL